MNFLIWILGGILAGWLVGLVMKGGGYGLVWDLVLGLLGGIVGGWILGYLGANIPVSGWIGHLLVAVMGGVVLVGVSRLLRRAL